jgi:hypothetical protein
VWIVQGLDDIGEQGSSDVWLHPDNAPECTDALLWLVGGKLLAVYFVEARGLGCFLAGNQNREHTNEQVDSV